MKADGRNLEPEIGPTVSLILMDIIFSLYLHVIALGSGSRYILRGRGSVRNFTTDIQNCQIPNPPISFRSQDFRKGAGPKWRPVQMPNVISGFIHVPVCPTSEDMKPHIITIYTYHIFVSPQNHTGTSATTREVFNRKEREGANGTVWRVCNYNLCDYFGIKCADFLLPSIIIFVYFFLYFFFFQTEYKLKSC